jgi:hypothetical protein
MKSRNVGYSSKCTPQNRSDEMTFVFAYDSSGRHHEFRLVFFFDSISSGNRPDLTFFSGVFDKKDG